LRDGERLLAERNRRGLEGVVAKHKNGIYRSDRSTSWIKVKWPAWREANRNRGICSVKVDLPPKLV
jgi:ATP-dependent DNA ligase